MTLTDSEVILEARGVTKTFPGVVANQDVSVTLRRGEVLSLLGENGAGKTTLMNILYGLYHQDSGEVFVRGKSVRINGPADSISRGIGMVHQHFMLIPVFTVAENIVLGAETVKGLSLDLDTARARIRDLSHQYGLDVEPDAYVKDLSVGQQQRVEIVKALYRRAEILILDEPTAVLTPQETNEFFEIVRSLTARGTSIIFISHKLKEVLAISDRIVVLRRGRVVGETTPAEATERSLAEMMVGRSVVLQVEKGPAAPKNTVLEVRDLSVTNDRGGASVSSVSLEVKAGEILGIAGVQGNGQTELVEAITGLRRPKSGTFSIDGRDLTKANPREISAAGCAHVPEDRQEDGLVLDFTVADNLVLNSYHRSPFARSILRDDAAIYKQALQLVGMYDIRTPSVLAPVANLSGGNKQKVVIARELSRPVKLLVAAQPTRGLDVGSIEFIHRAIIAQRDRGAAVLLVSAELDEILALADRVAVMYHGQIVSTVPVAETTREELGYLMAGGKAEDRAATA